MSIQQLVEESLSIADIPEKIRHDARRTQLNAICPYCSADVLDALDKVVNDWGGYGPPGTETVECPDCHKQTEFELAWRAVLYWAKPIVCLWAKEE